MKRKLLKAMALVLGSVGLVASGASSIGCLVFFFDEAEMPESLL